MFVGWAPTPSPPRSPTPAALTFPPGRTFWIHAWPLNYTEFDIATGPATPQELEEVAFDAGVQLGRGHPNESLKSEADHLRKNLLKRLSDERLQAMVAELAQETIAAWERFRDALQAP